MIRKEIEEKGENLIPWLELRVNPPTARSKLNSESVLWHAVNAKKGEFNILAKICTDWFHFIILQNLF